MGDIVAEEQMRRNPDVRLDRREGQWFHRFPGMALHTTLIVGIDYYDYLKATGRLRKRRTVNEGLKDILERNADGAINFATPRLLTRTGPGDLVNSRNAVRELF